MTQQLRDEGDICPACKGQGGAYSTQPYPNDTWRDCRAGCNGSGYVGESLRRLNDRYGTDGSGR